MCRGVFNKTIILLGLPGYEMIITKSALHASLVIYIISYPARPRRTIVKQSPEPSYALYFLSVDANGVGRFFNFGCFIYLIFAYIDSKSLPMHKNCSEMTFWLSIPLQVGE